MRGVWDYIHNKAQAPPPLTWGLWCEHYHRPLVDSGYDEQPVRRTKLMNLALNYYNGITGYKNARKRMDAKQFIKWQTENKAAVEIYARAAKEA